MESIDLEVSGSHTISNLTLQDVIDATDSRNDLKIFGDSLDKVDFDSSTSSGWLKNDAGHTVTENGKTFDIYTSSQDISVEVKVQQDIVDSI